MIKLLKRYKWFLIIGVIPYLILLYCFTIPQNYMIDFPGTIDPVKETVKVKDGFKTEGSFNSTCVWVFRKSTIFQKMIFEKVDYVEVYETPKYVLSMTTEEYNKQGEIEHNSAIESSIICAYKKANVAISYDYVGKYVYYLSEENDKLKIGDLVLGSSDQEVKDKVKDYANGIKILRNGKEMTVYPSSIKGVYLEYAKYNIKSVGKPYTVYESNNGGPSAGFLQTMSLFNSLVEFDYSRGKKIAGTGTIDIDGNVGAIGAVEQKVYTAYFNDVDIFMVPDANYEEAYKAFKKLKTKMKLVSISNIDEAISYLEGIE